MFANWETEQIGIDAGFVGASLFCCVPFLVGILLLVLWLLGTQQSYNNLEAWSKQNIQQILVCSDYNNSYKSYYC